MKRTDRTMVQEKFILGVDGGATRTTAAISDKCGNILAEHYTGSSNYKSVGERVAEENINRTVQGAMGSLDARVDRFESSCFGIAGNDTESDRKIYHKIIFNPWLKGFLNRAKTMICNDSRIGLEAGSTSKNRIMVICGTGSNCFGINSRGREARAGGWDYILGDEGSGYRVATKALRAVMKAYDGRGKSTILNGEILKYLGIGSEEDIVEWIYKKDMTKERISDLSIVVCRTAAMGDSISRKIFSEEAGEVVTSVSTVAKKLGISQKSFDLVLVGSVFKCEEYFKKVIFGRLRKRFTNIVFTELTEKPVLGAVRLAIKKL